MAQKPFHLGWFTNFAADQWNDPFAAGGSPWNGEFHVEMAKSLERACFDFIMFEDNLMTPTAYGGTMQAYLKNGITAPKHDPAPLAAVIGASTRNIGVVATLSTLAYHPFQLARLCTTLDHLSRGRFGWNIVNSSEDAAAQNFGLDKMPEHDLRYEMAHEYMDLVGQLFASWDKDAVVMDHASNTYADYTKVRPVNFKGKYYKSKGPLNTIPGPQGRPTYLQAGTSPAGRAFAARYADCVVATAEGVPAMKSLRADIRARAAAYGRDPDGIKLMYLISPVLGETGEEAQAKFTRMVTSPAYIERTLAFQSAISEIDFSVYDLDRPLPDLTTNGGRGTMGRFVQAGSGKPLRQLVAEGGTVASLELIGTPDRVAGLMAEAMEEVGGEGYLISSPFHRAGRYYITEIIEGLVPLLQRRNLARRAYTRSTLRDTLMEF